jgi:hypothetical protein
MEVTPEEASDAGKASVEHTETPVEGSFSGGLKESSAPRGRRSSSRDSPRIGSP